MENTVGFTLSRRARLLGIVGIAVALAVPALAQSAAVAAPPFAGFSQVSAGGNHTCGVATSDGAVWCWGLNSSGQLGIGSLLSRSTATKSGLTSGATIVESGTSHTCALQAGSVWCWGLNNHGQVGNNGTQSVGGVMSPTQVKVAGLLTPLTDVKAIAIGGEHSCALTNPGAVLCWGRNDAGQLGLGPTGGTSRFAATVISTLTNVKAIAASGKHTCAVTAADGVKCWGLNTVGAVGNGNATGPDNCGTVAVPIACAKSPVDVTGLANVAAIALGGQQSCALLSGGADVKCWGANGSGQLGNGQAGGTATGSPFPVSVAGERTPVSAISAGGSTTCALSGGGLQCWGSNTHGQVGDDTIVNRLVPVDVPGADANITDINVGNAHACLRLSTGKTKCWGANASGQLGDATHTDLYGPFIPDPPTAVTAFAGDGEASVTWTDPAYDGGAALTSFVVTASPGGIVQTVAATENSATFPTLTNGTAYTFTVVAKKSLTLGSRPSAPSAAVVPAGIPGAASALAVAPGDGAATVTWHAAPNNGSAVISYTIVASPGGKTATASRNNLRATVTGLRNGATYSFTLRAKNKVGTGPAAKITKKLPIPQSGYWMLGSDGKVYAFGNTKHYGDAFGGAVAISPRQDGKGYWVVDRAGNVRAFGAAHVYGGRPVLRAGESVSTISATPSGNGYVVFTSQGRAFPHGDARFYGDMGKVQLNGPVIASVATPTGHGYFMVASDGGVFSFGDAKFHGSTGGIHLNQPVVGLSPTPDNRGYWLVAADGGVFAFSATFRGSLGAIKLNKPVNGLVAFGNGYLMVSSDGGVFNFSNKPFVGSLGAHPPAAPIIGIAAFAPH